MAFCLTAGEHSAARRARPGFVAEGGFIGRISDPMSVSADADGVIRVTRPA